MTAAVNGCVFLTTMEAVLGEIEIVTGGSGLEAEIDAQPWNKKTEINGTMQKNMRGHSSSDRSAILK